MSSIIKYFIEIENKNFTHSNGIFNPLIDDRMFIHAYYSIKPAQANYIFIKKLKKYF